MFEAGTTFGPYEVVEVLGAGGMGEVYKARDTRLGRIVALKVIRSDKAMHSDRRHRLLQEARAASSLNHPNIIDLHDILSDDRGDVLVLEYVQGRTLSDCIRGKGLHLSEAFRYAIQIADALAAAHKAGIVHRDLKPSNVIISDTGVVKVLDFGLAKFTERTQVTGSDQTQTIATADHTDEGLVVGTAAYMSPEQAQARPVDARSDIFSFGTVLYEMVTGQKAFGGASTVSTLSAIVRDDPTAALQQRANLPPELHKLIARCMRKDPNRRFQTMADLKVALEDVAEESSSAAMTPAAVPVRRNYWKIVLLTMIPVVAASVGLWKWRTAAPDKPDAVLRALPVTTDPGEEAQPSFSPDGEQIVYAAGDTAGKDSDLYIVALGTGAKLHLSPGPTSDTMPRWSPDGRWIAFSRNGIGIFLISPLGGLARKVAALDGLAQIAWMPDSRWLLVAQWPRTQGSGAGSLQLSMIDIESGGITRIDSTQMAPNPFGDLALSADGQTVARVESKSGEPDVIVLYRLENSVLKRTGVTPLTAGYTAGIAFLPDNRTLLASVGPNIANMRLFKVRLDAGTREALSVDVPQAIGPVVSRRGDRVAFIRETQDENLYRLSLSRTGSQSAQPEPFATSTARDTNANISPDGSRVAFASYRNGGPDIYISDAAGAAVQRLTTLKAFVAGSPRFSPDGRWIAFDAWYAAGEADVYIMPAEGGPPQKVTNHAGADGVPTWSRDGKHIYFHSNRTGSSQIWRMKADGSDPVQITKLGGYIAFEAVDRTTVFYSKTNAPINELWAVSTNGGDERMVVNTLYRHNFAPAASGVYLSTAKGLNGGSEILYYSFADRTTTSVYRLPRPVALGLTVASDESWLVFSQYDTAGSDVMMIEGLH